MGTTASNMLPPSNMKPIEEPTITPLTRISRDIGQPDSRVETATTMCAAPSVVESYLQRAYEEDLPSERSVTLEDDEEESSELSNNVNNQMKPRIMVPETPPGSPTPPRRRKIAHRILSPDIVNKKISRGSSLRQKMMSAAEIQETLLNSTRSNYVGGDGDVGGGGDGGGGNGGWDGGSDNTVINGWDDSANRTLVNWYNAFDELSYSYQYILDRNFSISTTLSMVSIVSSSALGIFSGFKLWIRDDETFKNSSDAIMLVSNFVVAAITTMSKRYIDDARNEKIKAYVAELDSFMGLICAQITVTPDYRMPAKKFYETYMKDYTKLMITMPNMSIKEMIRAKLQYKLYKQAKAEESAVESDV